MAAALCNHGTGNDDVLWAALFTLAVLVRDDSVVFGRAASALVSAGIFKVWLGQGRIKVVFVMQGLSADFGLDA